LVIATVLGLVAAVGLVIEPGGDALAAGARVGIWGPSVNSGGTSFTNQTIRHVVYASSGGTAPRVRLSNLRGTSPLVIGHVDLAEQSLGGITKPGTHHRLTFGGAGTVTIPAGQERFSDAADMTVIAGQNLLISVYVPGTTGQSTHHPDSLMTTYLSNAGNFAADDASTNYPGRLNGWHFLSGLDVVSASATGTIVAFGDSITDGYSSTPLTNRRYPDYLARRLWTESGGAPPLGVVNAGLSRNSVLRDGGPTSGLSALNRFAHDALSHPGVTRVILLEGINDITTPSNPPVTSWDLRAAYQTLIDTAHASGVQIYGGTILPFGGSTPYTTAREATRQALNNWIRTSGAFDGVVDYDAALRDPSNPSAMLTAYAHTDWLHPNDAGMQRMAEEVDLAMITS
jgi:lysophospholipase L1-like esterase